MIDARQQMWVVRNRRSRIRAVPAVDLAERFMKQACDRAQFASDSVRRCVEATVDEEFIEHCTVGTVRAGVLTILVDDERLVYTLRMCWERRLLETLRRQCPSWRVSGVRFTRC